MIKLPQFAKFTISSVISAGIDFGVFYLINLALFQSGTGTKMAIILATIGARIASTIVNFTINKLWCFQSKKGTIKEAVMFFILFVLKMSASAALVAALSTVISINPTFIKVFVDIMLFFVSFAVQKLVIFK